MSHKDPAGGGESPFSLEALHSPGRAVEEPREWGRLHQVARALSPRARRHLERALVQDALDRGRRDRRRLARGVLSLRRAVDGHGARRNEALDERELDVAEAQVVAPLLESQGHAGADGESPFDDNESPFIDGESPFVDNESPFLDAESPFLDREAAASSPFDGLSASEMKALYITSTFETGRAGSFGGLTGNFDGQGLSFGLMNFAWKAGSLTSLLATFIKDHPAAFASAFGPDAARFKEVVLATKPDPKNPKVRARDVDRQMKFAVEVINNANKKVQEPWVTYFGRLERDPDFRRLQAKGAREAAKRARYWYDYFGLKTERGFAFMFDLVSSHGGAWLNAPKFKGKRRTLLRAMLDKKKAEAGRTALTELETLEVIANMIADVSLARWQNDVRTRKLWFVNGSGKVHGTFWHLANDFGVTDAPPNFDPTSGGLAKPPPAPVRARAKSKKKKAPGKAAPKPPAAKAPSPFDWSRMFGFGPPRAGASQELDDESEPSDNESEGAYASFDGEDVDEGELDDEAGDDEYELDDEAGADDESAWAGQEEGPDDEAYGDDEAELDDEAGDDEYELDDEAGDGGYAEPEVDDEYEADDEAGDDYESADDEGPPGGLDDEAAEGGLGAYEMFAIDEELEREAMAPWAEGEAAGDLLPADSVDEAAAELPFSAALRAPSLPLLSPAKAAAAVKWNAQRHPSASGITIEALGRRLDAYIDRQKLAEAVRQANAAGASYPDDAPTLVALAAHQFQRRVLANAKAHDGMAGESTLDGLGFVRHRGSKLNIDRTNTTARAHLKAVQKKNPAAFSSLGPDVNAGTWFRLVVNAPFLGQTFTNGIHVELLRRLRRAQAHLMTLPRYKGMSPAELGRALNVNETHKGARPANTNKSMHTFGLAVDISYWQNPWVAGSNFLKAESRQRFVDASGRSTLLVEGKAAPLTAARLSSWGNDRSLGTAEVYDRIKRRSEVFQKYLQMGEDSAALRAHLQAKKAEGAAGVFKPGESVDGAVARWTAQIKADLAGVQVTFGKRRPRDGFLNMPRDLVVALRDHGCLAWGGVDLGAGESGDMMHFDCRAQGVGYTIAPAKTVGAGHPCFGAGAGERELSFEGELAPKPAWVKRPSARGQLFRYKSAAAGGTTAVFVPSSMPAGAPVKVLVYMHGLLVCGGEGSDAVSYVKSKLFPLVDIVEQSGRGVVLVVPSMRWQKGQTAHRLGKPAAMNALVDEVRRGLTQAGWAEPPEVEGLYLAGHSKAFVALDALGRRSNLAASGEGALAKLREVWSLDTMYGVGSGACKAWLEWALRRPDVSFSVHYRPGSPTKTVSECLQAAVLARKTGASPKRGCNCDSAAAGAPTNVAVYPEKMSHCGMVKPLFAKRLAAMP